MDKSTKSKLPKSRYQDAVEIAKRAMKANSEWSDKEEFLDVIYWMRQIIGLVLGIIWGFLTLKGMFSIVLFGAINALIVYIYAVSFQRIEENDEENGIGMWDVVKEGFMTSLSTFLVSWIVIYTALTHH